MQSFVEHLLGHASIGPMVAHHRRLPATDPSYGEPREPLAPELRQALAQSGISRLYSHQAEGIDLTRSGRNVLVATPTASGKTLLFATALLESFRADPGARALVLYPTKALARDQLAGFRELSGGLGALQPPSFEIYDGDTPASRRRKIRSDPPNALITNPDMLHHGILANHDDWQPLLSRLEWVVLDEMHVYRGLFGVHVHHILARLRRLCRHHGARPRFVAASATVGNPAEFARTLVGEPFEVVSATGAPTAARDVVFLNPTGVSPYTVAVRVVAEMARAGLRGIAFTKARRVAELLYTWLVRQDPSLRDRVAPYRAGYLPSERRQLERRLFSGELSAVLSTSALELGIDVGGLDVCVLVGYPGSLITSWQRIGRVGRGRDGLVILIAMPDALDQYVVHHPELFFSGNFENAVLDPWNRFVAGRHLVCAASERALDREEVTEWGPRAEDLVRSLTDEGELAQGADGERWFSFRRRPQRDVNPRSSGQPYAIVAGRDGRVLGSIDASRVYSECHPGAVYLHGGRSYLVTNLDEDRRRAEVELSEVDFYTVVLGDKETQILERLESRRLGDFEVGLGRLEVTIRIHGYQKRRLFDGEPRSSHSLQVPVRKFETVGFWIELPEELPAAFASRGLHFMGGIHATEHATIGLFPLQAIADRDDIGGISYTGHPQLGRPAIFVYDGVPGGAGLAEQGYESLENLLRCTLQRVAECPCEDGCPGCIQSPKCGNGNKPLDKAAALSVLRLFLGEEALSSLGVEPVVPREVAPMPERPADAVPDLDGRHGMRRAGNVDPQTSPVSPPAASGTPRSPRDAEPVVATPVVADRAAAPVPTRELASKAARTSPARDEQLVFFDLETQRSAEEVGGWQNTKRMGLGLAVVYDSRREAYRTYYEADVDRLLADLALADRVVGFNLDRFDLVVLSAYTDQNLGRIRTLDLLGEIHATLGFRISLAHLSEVNLGESKAGSGLQSLVWWKEGRIDLIEHYCRKDVELTRRIYELGRQQGFLLYRGRDETRLRVPVHW